ncbi:MAG: cbb3-type cytochrome c oxidase subunit I, partial [Candidatus Carbobacillus sp.]|nr:cbb3-type cytochrome c oxidase subunit I [Candidatus Carbobacillus sp.]
MAHLFVAFGALLIGATAGLLQTLVRTGKVTLPAGIDYYQILTVHGVILGFILTTFFIIDFILAAQSKTAGAYSAGERQWAWTGFTLMTVGVVTTSTFILLNEASVLYTFYAPLQAHPGFYIGLTLLVVGSWLEGFVVFRRHARWRKDHPGERSPLLSYMGVITML